MKKIFALLVLLVTISGFSQSVNDYKYVIIPRKFAFVKDENKYNLNTLTKMLFEKQGFTVLYDTDAKPAELALDRCKALYGNVNKEASFLSTNLSITLDDCTGKTIFKSVTGRSKLKDYQKAYYEALREAAASVDLLNYHYTGGEAAKNEDAAANANASAPSFSDMTLFAQPISNGFQLVDTTPKVVLRIYKTSKPDSFTAISDKNNGLVFKKDNDWYFEYYENDQLISQKLNLKF